MTLIATLRWVVDDAMNDHAGFLVERSLDGAVIYNYLRNCTRTEFGHVDELELPDVLDYRVWALRPTGREQVASLTVDVAIVED